MSDIKLARTPVPEGVPRRWLVDEVLRQGAIALPCVLTSVQGTERLLALPEDPQRMEGKTSAEGMSDLGAVESALFEQFALSWVGAWGTAVLDRDGRPALVTFARIREADGTVFVSVWPRTPGMAPIAELAEQYDGPLVDAPRWLRGLFPPLEPSTVVFVPWELEPATRAERSGDSEAPTVEMESRPSRSPSATSLPTPDFGQTLPDGASFEDALVVAAHRLEARFVGGETGPALVAWHDEGISGWFAEDESAAGALRMLGSRIAYDARIKGLGLFGIGEDEGLDPPARLIALAMESRDGDRIVWVRRFRIGAGSMATWVDETGFVRRPGPRIGWFEAPEG